LQPLLEYGHLLLECVHLLGHLLLKCGLLGHLLLECIHLLGRLLLECVCSARCGQISNVSKLCGKGCYPTARRN
jgi:hypothetical protein